MTIIVSDTSPLRALAHLNLLGLLKSLFGEVLVPPAVAAELLHPKVPLAPVDVAKIESVRTVAPRDKVAVSQLMDVDELDAGEAEAIALAIELRANLLLIDERKGTIVARQKGLEAVGVLGVLLEAKQGGLVTAVNRFLNDWERI